MNWQLAWMFGGSVAYVVFVVTTTFAMIHSDERREKRRKR
jgi:hypothetical protein